MHILSVDPGETSGVATYNTETRAFEVAQFDNRQALAHWVHEHWDFTTVLVEDYQSAGSMTKEARYTIELLGWLNAYFYWAHGTTPYNPAPQARLSGVAEATELIGDEKLQSMHRKGRDAISALAHAIAWNRRYNS